jgi:hypothetical protein
MATGSLIGSLRVALGLDTASFVSGARKAEGTLAGLGSSIKGFAAGALGALSMGGLAAVVQSSVNRMDDLGKAAQKIGIPVEQLSSLEYAAKLADLSVEGLQTSIKKLSTGVAELAGGGKSDAGEALRAMGVAALDANGKIRPTSDILADVADKFSSYRDGAEKSALAVALFGRSGLDMIPMLNGGSAALRQATEEAKLFGIVVSKEAAASAEEFNDNLTRIWEVGKGFVQMIATAVVPALNNLAVEFLNTSDKAGAFTEVGKQVKDFLTNLSMGAVQTAQEFRSLGVIFGVMRENWEKGGGFEAASARWKAAFEQIKQDAEETSFRIDRMFNMAEDPTGSLASIDNLVSGMKQVTQSGAQAAPVIQTVAKGLTDAQKAAKKLAEEGKRVWESTRTPIEQYQLEISRLNELLQAGAINQDTYTRAVHGLQEGFKTATQSADTLANQINSELHGAFSNLVNSALDGVDSLNDSLMGLLKNLTNLALNSAFESIFSGGSHALYGGGGGLGSLFGNLLGFASGGAILPGGSGGIDSQLVMFHKSPNERVDITKPGQTLTRGDSRPVQVIDQRVNAPAMEREDSDAAIRYYVRDAVRQEVPGAVKEQMRGYNINKPTIRRGS